MKRITIIYVLLSLSFLANAQTQIPVPVGINDLNCINFYNDRGVAGGDQIEIAGPTTIYIGKIIYTSDGFNWSLANIPAGISTIRKIQLVNNSVGYAAGFRDNKIVLIKTTDTGENWSEISLLEGYSSISSVNFADEQSGLLAVDSSGHAKIIKTTNGGIDWNTKLSFSDSSLINKISMFNSTSGLALITKSDTSLLMRTADSGETWSGIQLPIHTNVNDISFTDSLTYYLVNITNSSAQGFKTTDGGLNWHIMNIPTNSVGARSVDFYPGEGMGFILWDIMISGYFKTTDFGETWSGPFEFAVPGDLSIGSTCFASGKRWFFTHSSLHQGSIFMLDGNLPTDIKDFVTPPVKNRLEQNYPNPFNPTTKIKFNLSVAENVSLKIYDTMGQLVCTLIDKVLHPGEYEAEFDAVKYNLSNGIYLCKMTTGNYTSTIKLLLLK